MIVIIPNYLFRDIKKPHTTKTLCFKVYGGIRTKFVHFFNFFLKIKNERVRQAYKISSDTNINIFYIIVIIL